MGQNSTKKKRHTGRKIFLALLFLLAAAATGVAIYFYPAYRAAGYMAETLNLQKMDYTLEVTINRDELGKKPRMLLDVLAEITGITREGICCLTIRGSVDGDIVYARIYAEGQEEPLTELYLSDELDVVNGAMLYGVMREHFCSRNEMLNQLFPVWEDHKYMSLKQAEDMFEVDLSDLRDFSLPLRERKPSRLQCFFLLALMSREETDAGEQFTFQTEGLEAELWLRSMTAVIRLEKPAEVLGRMEEKFSKTRICLNGERLQTLDGLAVAVEMREDITLRIPDDLVSQTMVDVVKGIRTVLRELSGKQDR